MRKKEVKVGIFRDPHLWLGLVVGFPLGLAIGKYLVGPLVDMYLEEKEEEKDDK